MPCRLCVNGCKKSLSSLETAQKEKRLQEWKHLTQQQPRCLWASGFPALRGLAGLVHVNLPPLAQSLRPAATLLNLIEEASKKVESGTWPVPQLLRPPPLRLPRWRVRVRLRSSPCRGGMSGWQTLSASPPSVYMFSSTWCLFLVARPVLAPEWEGVRTAP